MANDDLARTAGLFRAMGHPIRLGVLDRLRREGEICACDFTEYFGVSQPTISGHLRTLREVGLVRTRRDGTQICYSLEPGALEVVRRMSTSLVPVS
ncbi:ArsR/SmtB family transcription factor [Saccharopolyspora spinosa]|uniref:ArsR family transcriptional regulator n=1 Tax=Saccharopolyspora spinosa TaxID=60894 RepID=A0A2N3XW53_SACSN|nr:metalloregulator ArsR/SmtB family transcription factor [Saccharopolyspora spinosa]PKW14907.1 ArsR family transcriptional regulator [Saccharopolyspora spinosa]